MALARMVAHSNVRRLVVVLSIVSALAFTLGQGVAAYQTNLVRRQVDALQHMAGQVRAQVTEQIAIARGVTPTPTVRVPGNRPAAHSRGAHSAVSTTAALLSAQQPASVTQPASDAQKGKHGDSNGDAHQKQKSDQQGNHQQDQQKTQDASGQGSDNTAGNQGSDTTNGQGGGQQKPDKHNDGSDPSSATSGAVIDASSQP